MDELSNKLVSIIIVTFGIEDYLKHCLDSIKKQSYPELEIIVIDNSPNQSAVQEISKSSPCAQEPGKSYRGIKVYSGMKNLYYCAGLNKGIEISSGDFVLCLNDDVILNKEFIGEALKGFDIEPRVAIVSGKILRFDRESIDSAGLVLTLWRTARERGYGLRDRGQFEKEGYIFGVNGAVAFYRREMLEEIKQGKDYFDSDYRFFYEDLDIAWRAQNFGWRGYYIPSAIACHIRGGSLRTKAGKAKPYARMYLSDALHFDLIKNRYLTIIKNESWVSFLIHLPAIILYDLVIWSYVLLFNPCLIKLFLVSMPEYLDSAFIKRKKKNALPS